MRGAAGGRPVVGLEHHECGSLAHHEAVTVVVERPGGGGRVGVLAQRPHAGEGGHRHGAHAGLGAAADDHVGHAVAQEACALADRVGAGGAGGGDRQVGPGEPVADGDQCSGGVGHHHRHQEGPDAAGSLFGVADDLVLERANAADAGTGDDRAADRVGAEVVGRRCREELARGIHAHAGGVSHRVGGGGNGQQGGPVGAAHLLGPHVRHGVEAARPRRRSAPSGRRRRRA